MGKLLDKFNAIAEKWAENYFYFGPTVAKSRQSKEATGNETAETCQSENDGQGKEQNKPSFRIFTLPPETILYMPGTQSAFKCGDVCDNCKNNTDCKTYQRLLDFCKTFVCKYRQRTTIHQKQAIKGNLGKVGGRLINQRRHLVTKRITSRHLRRLRKSSINLFLVHKQHSKTKQDGQENITNGTDRQINWDVDWQTLTNNWITDNWRGIR